MDKQPILTDEELTMLRELGNAEEMATGQFLRGYLNPPLQSLLQRADALVLEARIAGHQLRFPLYNTEQEEGHGELRIAAPAISELGHAHLRPWRLDVSASLQTADGTYEVPSLSVGGLIATGLPPTLGRGNTFDGILLIESLLPLPITATLIRPIRSHRPGQDWALQYQLGQVDRERLRDWIFLRHQDAFTREYQAE
ncbi:PilZ domain-containing protein [Aeromonas veronii]|uniref:PilZ domain-containing protein n=1 Tax=Aeromonas TaxID=642 RepID=UPI0032F00D32